MKKIIIIVIVSTLFLASCNSVRESAGVNRKVIDEYAVIENPPLVIPPNFDLLPPEQMESKDLEDANSELAKEILFGLEDSESQLIQENSLMSQIIKDSGAVGEFNLGNLFINIVRIKEYTDNLIKLK